MYTKKITIQDPTGLHLRVATRLVELVKKYDATVSLCREDELEADAGSIIEVLLLAARSGSQITIKTSGPEAEQALRGVDGFFTDGGGI